ncbi:MAG TPA: sulfatase, partial [Pedobacter sp.]|nr:sulfatase [Pedobacter sp.]
MKSIYLYLFFQLICFNVFAQNKPNIILFLVDDMGWMDTSQPFGNSTMPLNKQFHTPNMERMAKQGVLFSNAYVNAVCTPTRTSLITGSSSARTHVTNWTSIHANEQTDFPDSVLKTPDWNVNGLSTGANQQSFLIKKPLPQILKEAGYFTIHVGKAHWGSLGTSGSDPTELGFIVNIAGSSLGHPQSYLGTDNYGNLPGKTTFNAVPDLQQFYGKDIFLTEALTQKAKKAMDYPIQHQKPFFLSLCHYAVHLPIQKDNRFVDRYIKAGLDPTEAAYASLIEGMDKSLGDIMDFLEKKGIAKNTIIIFMSDNGGLANTGRGGKPNTQNYPLRGGKGSAYEGGIRVPLMVKWPGVTKPNQRTNQYVMVEDFFPSVLEMAAIKEVDKSTIRDGKSYVPLLKNVSYTDTTRALIFHYPHRWTKNENEAIAWTSAIRLGSWKLIYLMKKKQLELYNLASDLSET